MRSWVRFLPLVVVELIAKRKCERVPLSGWEVVKPFNGVIFIIGEQSAKPKESKVDE